jgi:hypothetical protein
MSDERHEQRVYDHRLRQLVQRSGDIRVATEIGVPRSTAAGWLRAEPQDVISLDVLGMQETELQIEVVKLRKRVLVLTTMVRLFVSLVRLSGVRLDARSLPGDAMAALLGTRSARARSCSSIPSSASSAYPRLATTPGPAPTQTAIRPTQRAAPREFRTS